MSLINDALKKAQRERSGAPQQPTPATPAQPLPLGDGGARPAAKPATRLWPIALVALVGGGAAVWFLKPAAPAPVAVAAVVQPAPPIVPEVKSHPQPPPAAPVTAPAIPVSSQAAHSPAKGKNK